jgi:hypothetical protein
MGPVSIGLRGNGPTKATFPVMAYGGLVVGGDYSVTLGLQQTSYIEGLPTEGDIRAALLRWAPFSGGTLSLTDVVISSDGSQAIVYYHVNQATVVTVGDMAVAMASTINDACNCSAQVYGVTSVPSQQSTGPAAPQAGTSSTGVEAAIAAQPPPTKPGTPWWQWGLLGAGGLVLLIVLLK